MTEDDIQMWRDVGFDYTRPPPPPVAVDVELTAVEPAPYMRNTGTCSLAAVREAQRLVEDSKAAVIERARELVDAAKARSGQERAVERLAVTINLLDAQRVLLRAREEARR